MAPIIIGILKIELAIPYPETIKEKRNRLRSIKDRVRSKFNVSIAEIPSDIPYSSRSVIAITAVSGDTNYVNSILANVFNVIERFYSDIIASYTTDFIVHE